MAFMDAAPEGVSRMLVGLSAAVSLTDDVATSLIMQCPDTGMRPEVFIDCLRTSDFVVERNGEYRLEQSARAFLVGQLYDDHELAVRMHTTLLALTREASPGGGHVVPSYLPTQVARAYHSAVSLSEDEKRLELYRAAYTGRHTGDQWLLGVLAREQQIHRVLPARAIEPYFYQGMSAYYEERLSEAEESFAVVAASGVLRVEVAIALHLLGRILHRQGKDAQAAEHLRRSLNFLERLGDLHGQAQVLNSLATAVKASDPKQAENLLRRSLEIGRQLKDEAHQGQVRNTLGNLIGARDTAKAEEHLRSSLEIRKKRGDLRGQAQVLQSLAKQIKRKQPALAEEYLRESLEIDRQLGNLPGQAQVLNSLAVLIQGKRRDEAVKLLRESIQINERLDDREGQSKALNSLGNILNRARKWEEARVAFHQVVKLTENPVSLTIAHLGLALVAQHRDKDLRKARQHLLGAKEFQKRTSRPDLLSTIEARLREIGD